MSDGGMNGMEIQGEIKTYPPVHPHQCPTCHYDASLACDAGNRMCFAPVEVEDDDMTVPCPEWEPRVDRDALARMLASFMEEQDTYEFRDRYGRDAEGCAEEVRAMLEWPADVRAIIDDIASCDFVGVPGRDERLYELEKLSAELCF